MSVKNLLIGYRENRKIDTEDFHTNPSLSLFFFPLDFYAGNTNPTYSLVFYL